MLFLHFSLSLSLSSLLFFDSPSPVSICLTTWIAYCVNKQTQTNTRTHMHIANDFIPYRHLSWWHCFVYFPHTHTPTHALDWWFNLYQNIYKYYILKIYVHFFIENSYTCLHMFWINICGDIRIEILISRIFWTNCDWVNCIDRLAVQ